MVGELEVPGYSSYLHPVGKGRLLAVGMDGNEDGWIDVMGVVSDAKVNSLSEAPTPMIYLPLSPSGVKRRNRCC